MKWDGTATISTTPSPLGQAVGGSGSTNFSGNHTLLGTLTASNSATLSFTSWTTGYQYYIIDWIGIIPVTNATHFQFNISINAGSTYINPTNDLGGWEVTSSGSTAGFTDTAASTSVIFLTDVISNASTGSSNGHMKLWNLDSGVLWKQFWAHSVSQSSATANLMTSRDQNGHYRETSAVNGLQFSMSSGNISSGIINFYGVN